MKWSDKKGIQHLVNICAEQGVKHVIVSPGSRNAPLTISFNRHSSFETLAIPDERVAGFIALGIAQQTEKPVALICTSGSALLNYAPAIVEAFYNKIPLVVLSADRPQYKIDQRDGQAINQKEVYQNFIKGSFNLPLEDGENKTLLAQNQMINEALNLAQSGHQGPVQINVPLEEPLYNLEAITEVNSVINRQRAQAPVLQEAQISELTSAIALFGKIMVLIGQGQEKNIPADALRRLVKDKKVVVLSECTSNFLGEDIVGCIDRNIINTSDEDWGKFQPELLISFGGNIVSKKIKQKLRLNGINEHWHIDPFDKIVETYKCQTKTVHTTPFNFFEKIQIENVSESYVALWMKHKQSIRAAHYTALEEVPFSDMKVFESILKHVPKNTQLHLSNSSPVRYAQLFDHRTDLKYYGNRGVSGIDGSTSTAIGSAIAANELVTFVSGDMSYFYDSNSFWHSHVPDNFRCIVINNGGGGIFRIIEGPDSVEELEQFFEVHQKNDIGKIAEAYGVDFIRAKSEEEVEPKLIELFKVKTKATIMEIVTPRRENSKILKKYFSEIRALTNDV